MNKVFFDLEWNTGFLDGNSFDEIIEIGAVKPMKNIGRSMDSGG